MANYDRRILVPYLRDVCCTELLCRKLGEDLVSYQAEANKYTQWANGSYEDPKYPNRMAYSSGEEDVTAPTLVGAGFCVAGLMLFSIPHLGIILGIGAILFGLLMLFVCWAESSEANKKVDERYKAALESYNKQIEQNKSWRESRPAWRATAQRWREKENKARADLQSARLLRNKLYAVNVIPSRYRNIHAAYYLFDYFSSGRETDLDKIIQTMLLDEIIQRMDKLIVLNQQILLNQRRQIALQEGQNRAIAENHRREMEHLARMERNQELQLDYQYMIERNQEVTNFFLAADYLRKN